MEEEVKILIVEDDPDISHILAKIMHLQGYVPTQAFSGSEANLRLFSEGTGREEYDLILMDLMLPGLPGEELIERIRETSDVPIIVLSAKSALEDRVGVLNMGADDYLTKPFEKEEVIARVNSALRRYGRGRKQAGTTKEQTLSYKNLKIYPEAREVTVCERPLSLTAHEYDILCLLVQNPGKVYSRESLYELIWQGSYLGEDNTINVHVSNLRKKIAVLDETEYIKTVWGIGFKMA